MTKYRLNIKYPITEKDTKILADNDKSICWAYKRNLEYTSSDPTSFNGYPKSWIEEIKESAFDKWLDNYTHGKAVYDNNIMASDNFIPIAKHAWQASQENRDLLYKPLIDELSCQLSKYGLSVDVIKHLKDIDEKG